MNKLYIILFIYFITLIGLSKTVTDIIIACLSTLAIVVTDYIFKN